MSFIVRSIALVPPSSCGVGRSTTRLMALHSADGSCTMAAMNSEPVSVHIVRIVKAGQEKAFEESLRDFFVSAKPIPGQLSVSVVRPLASEASQEWGILRTFDSEQHRDEFYSSRLFREYESHIAQYTDCPAKITQISGLETWFAIPGTKAIVPPPKWKMALVTYVAVYLTSSLVSQSIGTSVQTYPRWLASGISVAIVVVALTWVVMPLMVRVFRPWLYQSLLRKSGSPA